MTTAADETESSPTVLTRALPEGWVCPHAALPSAMEGGGSGSSGDGIAARVNRETVMVLGWGRALLLQLAHPLVAAGVAEHSLFLARPAERWHRFGRTVESMAALAVGSDEEARRAARIVNARHDHVQGRLDAAAGIFPAGTLYSARDPALLRWVHATTIDSTLRAHERFVGPLTPAEQDRYCVEMGRIARLLGIPAADVPTHVADLRRSIDETLASGAITVTGSARVLADDLFRTHAPRGTGALRWLVKLAAVGLLPPAVRRGYGFPWDARHEAALICATAALRGLRPVLPNPRAALAHVMRDSAGPIASRHP